MPRKHGHAVKRRTSAEYIIWAGIKNRCRNSSHKHYHLYGGKGIRLCARWQTFANFFADMGPRPSTYHTVEREDGSKGYDPTNCRWATKKEQARNTSRNRWLTYKGDRRCIAEWAELTGLKEGTIRSRLRLGWSIEDTLETMDDDRCHLVTFRGETRSLHEWGELLGVLSSCLRQRLSKLGWSVEKTMTTPIRAIRRRQ